jgi:hypothetical protein
MGFTDAFHASREPSAWVRCAASGGDPEAKCFVERANRYLETSFLPRHFVDLDDSNRPLTGWLRRANM